MNLGYVWYVADLHIPAVHVPSLYCLLWVLGVGCGTQVPSLSTLGAFHPGQLHAQRPSGSERDGGIYSNIRSCLPVICHCSQHRCAHLPLCQVTECYTLFIYFCVQGDTENRPEICAIFHYCLAFDCIQNSGSCLACGGCAGVLEI